jgi:hypothetical protein
LRDDDFSVIAENGSRTICIHFGENETQQVPKYFWNVIERSMCASLMVYQKKTTRQ